MKAFTMSLAALAGIVVVAAVVLKFVPMSSSDVYTDRSKVRL
jgi:hypothetical protein